MKQPLILIVDDNLDILDTFRRLLEAEGFNVIIAGSASTGYEQLARHQPHLILTDLGMPDMTGIEFILWVRRTAEFMNMPIIGMTAYDREYLKAAVSAGANASFHKLDDFGKIIAMIHELLVEPGYQASASA
jgi:two-component system, OmpR family, KDP operon response regulator KdpE